MRVLLIAVLSAVLIAAALGVSTAGAQELSSVKVHAGMVDLDAIVSGEKRLPLIDPIIETEPAFDPEINSYKVRVPYSVEGVTLDVQASSMYEFGVVDLNGARADSRSVSYSQRMTMSEGAITPIGLEPGDNHLRLGVQSFGTTVIYEFLITRPLAASVEKALAALQLGGGELSPDFDPDVRTYRTQIVGSDRLTVQATPGAGTSVMLLGAAADGSALEVAGDVVSGLTPGDNTIAMVVQAEDQTSALYVLLARVTPSGDARLASLELANGVLSPVFGPATRAYRTRIVGNALTVNPASNARATVRVSGRAANGAPLQVEGGSVAGLTAGDNTVSIEVQAQDGTVESYTVVVEVSDDIRAVREGDEISRPGDCDSDIGCDGTLNGVEGRFACSGVDWRSESSNMQISVTGMCLLSTQGSEVTSVAGWHFAAFPAGSR